MACSATAHAKASWPAAATSSMPRHHHRRCWLRWPTRTTVTRLSPAAPSASARSARSAPCSPPVSYPPQLAAPALSFGPTRHDTADQPPSKSGSSALDRAAGVLVSRPSWTMVAAARIVAIRRFATAGIRPPSPMSTATLPDTASPTRLRSALGDRTQAIPIVRGGDPRLSSMRFFALSAAHPAARKVRVAPRIAQRTLSIARHDCTQQTGSPWRSRNRLGLARVKMLGIPSVFPFLTVQFYVAGPSDPIRRSPGCRRAGTG